MWWGRLILSGLVVEGSGDESNAAFWINFVNDLIALSISMLDLRDIDRLIFVSSVCWNSFQFVGPGGRVGIFFNEIALEFIVRSVGEW